jgi:acyl-CoA dehydrogenase
VTFRSEAGAWILDNAPAALFGTRSGKFGGSWGGRKERDLNPDLALWRERMLGRGWTAPTWPMEYGGGGLSANDGRAIEEILAELKLPPPVVGFGLTMIGPTLLDYGTTEQKARFLPLIVRGEIRWCQGYSEPGAGSDLASLSTRAVQNDDHFVVSGQKIWTSHADESDWIFCLTRTSSDGPKQTGITFLLLDLDSPGVDVRRIELISGQSPFCEVFLDEVRVPASQVVGAVGQGWTVAKALLGYEREMVGEAMGGTLRDVEGELTALMQTHGAQRYATDVTSLSMDAQCFLDTVARVQHRSKSGSPGPEGSVLKIFGSELKKRRFELAARIAGGAALSSDDPLCVDWLRSRATTIEGGTTEIQLNIIAKRVLGLPDRRTQLSWDYGDEGLLDRDERLTLFETADRFFADAGSVDRARRLRWTNPGYSQDLWQKMDDLGWLDPALGLCEACLIIEAAGRHLAPEPLVAHRHGAGTPDHGTRRVDGRPIWRHDTEPNDGAIVALCAEMLGVSIGAFERTLTHLKERVQFGQTIGSFQALQHRAARLYVELTLARTAVYTAANAVDNEDPGAGRLVALAKARLGDTSRLVTGEAIQMHGGIGMTEEHDIGLFLKRAHVCDTLYGDTHHHTARWAKTT